MSIFGRVAERPWLERLAAGLHVVHGTRGLGLAALGLLILGLTDPLVPADANRLFFVGPVFVLLLAGLSTLSREGVAAQRRVRTAMTEEHGLQKMALNLGWPALLIVLLAPRLFLGAYGIPSMNPFTGILLPAAQQTLTLTFLFAVLLVPVFSLRATKRYGRHIIPKRPKDLSREDKSHQERDALLFMLAGVVFAWGWLLRPFWSPFSILSWPPSLDSVADGVRGISSITFAIAIPALLFITMTAYARGIREALRWKDPEQHRGYLALCTMHIVLNLGALILHAYALLWIVQYRNAVPF